MNSRRIGVTFLLQMLCSFLLIFGITVYYMSNPAGRNLGIVENLIVSQSVNVLPLAFMLLIGRRKFRDEKFSGIYWGFGV